VLGCTPVYRLSEWTVAAGVVGSTGALGTGVGHVELDSPWMMFLRHPACSAHQSVATHPTMRVLEQCPPENPSAATPSHSSVRPPRRRNHTGTGMEFDGEPASCSAPLRLPESTVGDVAGPVTLPRFEPATSAVPKAVSRAPHPCDLCHHGTHMPLIGRCAQRPRHLGRSGLLDDLLDGR